MLDTPVPPPRLAPRQIGKAELEQLRADIEDSPPGTASVLREICDVALLACDTDGNEALEAETAAFLRLVASPTAQQGGKFFAGLKRIHDRIVTVPPPIRATPPDIPDVTRMAVPIAVPSALVDVFLPRGLKTIETVVLLDSASDVDIARTAAAVAGQAVPVVLQQHQSPDPLDQAIIDVLKAGLR